jgi:asparagine synthase (glutamine-hydrolysing)
MCGISCCLTFEDHKPTQDQNQTNGEANGATSLKEELEASLNQIKHRGPDSRGKWISSDECVGPRTSPTEPLTTH